MKLSSLSIQNFKLFQDFHLEDLKRINLFAGKNNTGKTALLEAIRIWAAQEDLSVIRSILEQRGAGRSNYKTLYDPLFNQKYLESFETSDNFSARFYVNDFFLEKNTENRSFYSYGIHTNNGLKNEREYSGMISYPIKPNDSVVYFPFDGAQYFPSLDLWKQIVLTTKEDKLIEILQKTLLPELVRLDVLDANTTLVRLSTADKPVPLKQLGDGAQRMLMLAMALVSAENNILLIDEIEAGLHYSVLENMWALIFQYARDLNVQVFATTHSQDALKAFVGVLEQQEDKDQGIFYRLQPRRKTGDIEAVPYGEEDLELALDTNLEIR
jgi:AAA15 family ATPase/GTPase